MAIYIALLRGINVSGHKRIKMAELRTIFAKMGLRQVQTYIQSGNVLFVTEEEEAPLRQRIEQGILAALDMPVTVILRTASELERLIADCPLPLSGRHVPGQGEPVRSLHDRSTGGRTAPAPPRRRE